MNYISNNITGKKFTEQESRDLVNTLRKIDPLQIPRQHPDDYDFIAQRFLNRNVQSMPDVSRVWGIDPNDMSGDYQRREFNDLLNSESPLKFISYTDNRGYGFMRKGMAPYEDKLALPPPPIEEQILDTLKKIQNFLAPEDYKEVNRYANMTWVTYGGVLLKTYHVDLDSRYRQLDTNDPSLFTWELNTAQSVTGLGFLRSPNFQQIKRIKGSKLYLPYEDETQLETGVIDIEIRELSGNIGTSSDLSSTTDRVLRSYNLNYFIESVVDSDTILITPNPGDFIFNVPITTISSLTIRFLYPDGILAMPVDFLFAAVTIGSPTILTFIGHGLSTGDVVFINLFVSDSLLVDKQVNRPSGYTITVIDPDNFSIPVDTTGITLESGSVSVYINKYRWRLHLEFLCLES